MQFPKKGIEPSELFDHETINVKNSEKNNYFLNRHVIS
jgi:hypothetical protein